MVTPYDFVLRLKKSLLSTKKVLCDSTSEDFSLEWGEIVGPFIRRKIRRELSV